MRARRNVNPVVTTITHAIGSTPSRVQSSRRTLTRRSCSNAFKIQEFAILPLNFSEEKGELTPRQKLKRKTVEAKYAELIEASTTQECGEHVIAGRGELHVEWCLKDLREKHAGVTSLCWIRLSPTV